MPTVPKKRSAMRKMLLLRPLVLAVIASPNIFLTYNTIRDRGNEGVAQRGKILLLAFKIQSPSTSPQSRSRYDNSLKTSYLVLVEYHIGYAILHWKFPPSIRTNQVALDEINVEQRPVQSRYRRIVQRWNVTHCRRQLLRKVWQRWVAMRTQMSHGGPQGGIVDLGQKAD